METKYIRADLFMNRIAGKNLLTSEEIKFALEQEPAEDVQPVVHAHWIRTALDYGNKGYIRCSNCGADFSLPVHKMQGFYQRYCGMCGAKMDEDETVELTGR